MSRMRSILSGDLSLKLKIMAGVLGLILLFGAAVLGNIHYGLTKMLKVEMTRRGITIASVLTQAVGDTLIEGDLYALHELLKKTMLTYDDVRYIFVTDAEGRVLSHTFPKGFPRGLAAVHPLGAGHHRSTLTIRTKDGDVTDVAVVLLGGRMGSIHVGMKEYDVRRRVAGMEVRWALIAFCMLALGVLAAYGLTSRLAGRLGRLVRVTKEVGEGDLDARVRDGQKDEIGALAKAFNEMTSDLKRSQDHLIRTGKLAAIGQLASSVAHEINNPLNTMAVCVQALRDRAKSPELAGREDFSEFPEYLKTVEDEIFRCKEITSGLLDFARFKEPRQSPTDVNRIVNETLPLLAPQAKSARAKLIVEPSKSPALATVDTGQIKQVLLNVIINAMDHMPKGGGRIRVETRKRGRNVILTVEDTGEGIRAADLSRIFDPFFTTKPAGRGTGLGLAVCQKIVDNHHGKIEAASEPGKGTTFTITLPMDGERERGVPA